MTRRRSANDPTEPAEPASETTTGQPLTDRNYRALARFRHALRVFERFSEEKARAAGLTPAQHQLLLAIRGHHTPDRPPSLSELADVLQVRLHSAGELVNRAEANGLVTRQVDPTDHRRALLSLTHHGAQQLVALSVVHREELRRFHGQMTDLLRQLDD
ncbi:MAG: MarR family winged helix-turn-helix transcriptional regulator [Nocardioidaceae bacterium]